MAKEEEEANGKNGMGRKSSRGGWGEVFGKAYQYMGLPEGEVFAEKRIQKTTAYKG